MSANANENALKQMDQLPIGQALVKNIVPAIAAMLMMLVYNLADKVFIAMANNDYMVAAVTLVTPVFLLFMAVGNIFGTGGVALMSRLAGENNKKKINNVSSFCFWSALIIGVIVAVVMFAGREPLIKMLGASDAETIKYAKDYIAFIAISAPFAILSPVLSNLLRAEGKPTLSMIGSVVGNIINIVLDALFICVFHWGTAGAAAATLLGNLVAVVFYLYLIFTKKSSISIRLSDFSGKEKIASGVYAIGITAAISTIGQSLCQILMNTKMAVYGDIPVAGLGAACNIITIVMVFALGVAQGVQPLLGYQIGNQNKKKFNALLKCSSILLLVIAAILTAVCYLAMKSIIGCFVSGQEAIAYGVTFGKILLTTGWCYSIFQFCSLLIQVMNKPGAALVVNLSKNAYVFIPALAITSRLGGMNGVVWSMPVADVVSTIIAVPVTLYCIKKCFAGGKETEASQIHDEGLPITDSDAKTDYIICIGRSYGAGGRSVGKFVAEKLGIAFYDKLIMKETAEKSGLSRKYLDSVDETSAMTKRGSVYSNNSNIYTADQYTSVEDIAYKAQKEVLEKIASAGPCVIVGRCADQILRDNHKVFSVFISDSMDKRIKRVSERDGISMEEAKKKAVRVDKERSQYYDSIGSQKWGVAEGYDLTLNLSSMTLENAAEIVVSVLRLKEDYRAGGTEN